MVTVTNSKVCYSIFTKIERNMIVTISSPEFYEFPDTIKKLKELFGQRNSNQIELHVSLNMRNPQEIRKKGD